MTIIMDLLSENINNQVLQCHNKCKSYVDSLSNDPKNEEELLKLQQ